MVLSTLSEPLREIARYLRALRFLNQSQPVHFPSEFEKRAIIKGFLEQEGIDIFVETGTLFGNTVEAMLPYVQRAISIEISSQLAKDASARFSESPKVRIIHGDSAVVLPEIIRDLNTRALFWLDAHCSGGITGGDPNKNPIIDEIVTVLSDKEKQHVVLVDDARLFTGFRGYPSLRRLAKTVSDCRPEYRFCVFADIIRIYRSEHSPR